MSNMIQLNYDDLHKIVKTLNNEGDDTIQILSDTRQRVQNLHGEWSGEAADKFFAEMEVELLPALKRLANACDMAQDKLLEIMKIIHEADQDTAGNFTKGDFSGGMFGAIPGGRPPGGAGEDFGAGKFNEAGQAAGGGQPGDDFGAGQFNEAGQASQPNAAGSDVPSQSETPLGPDEQAATETPETTPEASGGGGGGGGGGSSQGMQGDLQGLGTGSVGPQQNAFAGAASGGAQNLPDHDFGGGSGGGAVPPVGSTPPTGGSQPTPDSSGGVVAGAAGLVGSAAVGAAVKAIKDKQDE